MPQRSRSNPLRDSDVVESLMERKLSVRNKEGNRLTLQLEGDVVWGVIHASMNCADLLHRYPARATAMPVRLPDLIARGDVSRGVSAIIARGIELLYDVRKTVSGLGALEIMKIAVTLVDAEANREIHELYRKFRKWRAAAMTVRDLSVTHAINLAARDDYFQRQACYQKSRMLQHAEYSQRSLERWSTVQGSGHTEEHASRQQHRDRLSGFRTEIATDVLRDIRRKVKRKKSEGLHWRAAHWWLTRFPGQTGVPALVREGNSNEPTTYYGVATRPRHMHANLNDAELMVRAPRLGQYLTSSVRPPICRLDNNPTARCQSVRVLPVRVS
ncbi:hypothetical protein EV401DRAFT_1896162 [Pisolithus croceorrhizus]|nr:hypothetical protein EV401DRAFT_1896162 [Pisolithus croceorrhizus]